VTFDPYAELGLPRDADETAVKRAYRAKAHKAHPDKGGKAEDFHEVQRAYDVLSDPERRKQFDETGNADAPQDPRDAARMALAKLVLESIARAPDVAHVDLVALIRGTVEQAIRQERKNREGIEQAIARQEAALARFQRKDLPGDDVVKAVITAAVAMARAQMPRHDHAIAGYELVLELLGEYTYQVDQVQWPGGLQGMGAFTSITGQQFGRGL
jgi:curved DNA-binding protein CbpA